MCSLKILCIYIFAVLAIGTVLCDDDENAVIPEDLAGIAKNIESLDLPINKSSMPSIEDAQKILKDKCKKYGGEGTYEKLEEAKDKVEACLRAQVNVTVLQDEIEAAKPTGDLDVVFAKYCKKTPTVLKCINEFTSVTEQCLEPKEKDSMKVILNVTESLANFVCYKDGDRIAMFIAEGGVECLTQQQEAVQRCFNETVGAKIPKDVPSMDDLPLLLIGSKECDSLLTLQQCVVSELENCNEPTPANIVESLFKFIRRVTPCSSFDEKGKAALVHSESTVGAAHVDRPAGIALVGLSVLLATVSLFSSRFSVSS